MNIHPTAIVSKKAKLAKDIEIGPYAIIEEDVQIGQRVKVYSHAQILNHTIVGEECQIHMGTILGHSPQIREKTQPNGRLIIGQRNVFREYTTIHRSSQNTGVTVIGNDNYLMAFAHVAHDCCIGNHVTICNGTLIAGHSTVEDYAFISGNVTVHQFCRIGKYSMIAGLSRVAKDVPPYMLVKGDSFIWALNSVGLRRANFSVDARSQIKKAFKLLYKSDLNVKQAIEQLRKEKGNSEIEYLVKFILNSKRGICGYKRLSLWKKISLNGILARHKKIPAYRLFQSR